MTWFSPETVVRQTERRSISVTKLFCSFSHLSVLIVFGNRSRNFVKITGLFESLTVDWYGSVHGKSFKRSFSSRGRRARKYLFAHLSCLAESNS